MFHILANTKAGTAGATNEDIPAQFDGWASVSANNHYLLPRDMMLAAFYGQGTGISNAQINAPTLRQIALPQISALNPTTAPISLAPINVLPPGQFPIKATDELEIDASNTDAGSQRYITLTWVTDGNMNVNPGQIIPIRATASITSGNLAWGSGVFTLSQALPAGFYDIVGMDVVGANLIAARLVFPQGGVKPGVLARQTTAIIPHEIFRRGRMGLFGSFDTYAQPGIELFGSAAPTTQTIWLDVIKRR